MDAYVSGLRDAGVNIWQDKSGAATGIPFSTKWFDVIKEALYLSSGAIIFESQNWKDSTPCQNELDLILQCNIPHVKLKVEEIYSDLDKTIQEVNEFYRNKVDTYENLTRTQLLSSAYEYSTGVDPYQLLEHTKGLSRTITYLITDLRAMSKYVRTHSFEGLDPKISESMTKFIEFAKKAMLRRAGVMLAGGILGLAAMITMYSGYQAMSEGMAKNENVYNGDAVSGQIAELREIDPLLAMEKAGSMNEDYLQVSSYFSLGMNAARLNDVRLPQAVKLSGGKEDIDVQASPEENSSSLYSAEMIKTSGSLVLTRFSDGASWTVNAPAAVEITAWNENGTHLAFACGSKIYVYDPSGYGTPIALEENFEKVASLRFIENNGTTCVEAVTERGTVLTWEDPLPENETQSSGINYGIFLHNTEAPTAVYVSDGGLVINQNGQISAISAPSECVLVSEGMAVSADNSLAAVICTKEDAYGIVCFDLNAKTVKWQTDSDVRIPGLCFSKDGSRLFGAAFGCTAVSLDAETGEISYESQPYYFQNIARWGDKLILTDYYGYAGLFDEDLTLVKELGRTNYAYMPCFSLAVAEKKGYMFTVNRGGGFTSYNERVNLNADSENLFIIPEMDRTAANTAVAVSADERYTAFGYPNGIVRIYEVDQMYLNHEIQAFGSAVSALQFSEDGTKLYVLNESGNIRALELDHYELSSDLPAMQRNWKAMLNRLEEKYEAYWSGLEKGGE